MSMGLLDYNINDKDKKNGGKLWIAFIVVLALMYVCIRGTIWSFNQTLEFLRPAFETNTEAVAFSIMIQYGPQPALFFIGVFFTRFRAVSRRRSNFLANQPAGVDVIKIPLVIENEYRMTIIYMAIAIFFFIGFSTIDFITNVGQINATYKAANASGTMVISNLLYGIMLAIGFFVLFTEEIFGNLIVYLFVIAEALGAMYDFKTKSFSRAQGFFKKASGRSDQNQNSGRSQVTNYRTQTAPQYATGQGTKPYHAPYPRPAGVQTTMSIDDLKTFIDEDE